MVNSVLGINMSPSRRDRSTVFCASELRVQEPDSRKACSASWKALSEKTKLAEQVV